jgi:hypothetical protein
MLALGAPSEAFFAGVRRVHPRHLASTFQPHFAQHRNRLVRVHALPFLAIAVLYVYQQGVTSNGLKLLYLPGSSSFIDEIYSDSSDLARFQSFSSSITNMQVLAGFNLANGFYAITQYGANNTPPESMPYFFVRTNSQYFLSTYDSRETNVSNIKSFLNTHFITNLIQ